MNSDTIARDLLARGFQPVLLKPRSKVPPTEGWQHLRYTAIDVARVFGNGCNVGILLGEPSDNTVDLDVDHPKGGAALRAVGAPATLAYHHNGRPHLLFRCEPAPPTTKYQGTRSGKLITFIEVRSTGAQSVAPGSIHPDTGKPYEWTNNLPRADWVPQDALDFGRELATVCLLADHWGKPERGESGGRHHLALAVAGFLARRSDADTIARIVGGTATVMGDEERSDRLQAVRDTFHKVSQGLAVVGLPTLATLIGEDDARTLGKWWPEPPGLELVVPAAGVLAPTETEAPSPFLRPISDLLAQPEVPVDWLVDDLFSVGSSGWVGAEPKVGKSWLTLDLVYCLSTGTPFLDRFTIRQPRRVVYIQEEDSEQRVLRRFKQLLRGTPGRTAPPDDYLRFSIRQGFKIDSPLWMMRLRGELRAWPADVCVFDVFQRLHLKSENAQDQMAAVLAELDALNREFGCAFIVVHHNRKPQQGNEARGNQMLRGSGVLAGWAECSLYLKGGQAPGSLLVTPESKDAAAMDDFQVTIADQPNGGVRLVHSSAQGTAQQAAENHAVLDAIRELAHARVDCTREKIAERLGLTPSKAYRILKRLVALGAADEDRAVFGHTLTHLYSVAEADE